MIWHWAVLIFLSVLNKQLIAFQGSDLKNIRLTGSHILFLKYTHHMAAPELGCGSLNWEGIMAACEKAEIEWCCVATRKSERTIYDRIPDLSKGISRPISQRLIRGRGWDSLFDIVYTDAYRDKCTGCSAYVYVIGICHDPDEAVCRSFMTRR